MQLVKTEEKKLADYVSFLEKETIQELNYFAKLMKGKKVAMVNATSFGGGVAEKLHSMVPLMQDLGLEVDWWTIYGEEKFYQVTKSFHNCLQGQQGVLKEDDKSIYLDYNCLNASYLKNWNYDFVVIHDPQPAALLEFYEKKESEKWIWRCHIDTSCPNMSYWNFLYQFIKKYDASIFTMEEYVPQDCYSLPNVAFIAPSIDPLSAKNKTMKMDEAKHILKHLNINVEKPLITQISRFDPWKDPLGVIDAYKKAKEVIPDLQLALVGSMATDDPEGWGYLFKTLRKAGEDHDIKVIVNTGDREVAALQTASDILLQKSLREGFGLTVAEGLWKGTPVIGGNVGGIRLQIENGITGYLVNSVEECADKIVTLLQNPDLMKKMSLAGREKVRKEFLITRNILDYLRLFYRLAITGKPS
ncbi:MAG: glycosyltransferase [Firmicutes bacterium]|nr:glycosyltransferase [Bacillota bacterium]